MPTLRKRPGRGRKTSRWVKVTICLLAALLLVLGSLLLYFLVFHPDRQPVGGRREAEALKGSLNVMTEAEIQEALNNIVEEGMFRISIASNIVAFEHGKAEVRIENNMQNRYVMQVTIRLTETGEVIHETGLIDPGYYIQTTELDKDLAPGEYDATAVFTALYPDTEEIVGTVGAQVVIHVLPAGTTPTPSPSPTPSPTPTPDPALTASPLPQADP